MGIFDKLMDTMHLGNDYEDDYDDYDDDFDDEPEPRGSLFKKKDKKYYYDEASTARVSSKVQPLETESEEFHIWLPEEIADTDASLSMIVTYNPWEGINNDASGYGTKYQFVIQ